METALYSVYNKCSLIKTEVIRLIYKLAKGNSLGVEKTEKKGSKSCAWKLIQGLAPRLRWRWKVKSVR